MIWYFVTRKESLLYHESFVMHSMSASEFNQHITQSPHRYSYVRIGDATLEVIATSRGIFQAVVCF